MSSYRIDCTATTTTSTTTTITPLILVYLTQPGDPIIALYNTSAGESTQSFDGRYSNSNEDPRSVIDFNAATKYLNFGGISSAGQTHDGPGVGPGFFVTPSISLTTIARALLFATANNSPDRDPITVTLGGSNATTNAALNLGSSWTLIYSAPTGISSSFDLGGSVYVTQQNFSNTRAFTSYRLLVTFIRSPASSTQYSEAQILGYV